MHASRVAAAFGVNPGSHAGVSWPSLALVAAVALASGAALTYIPASVAAGSAVVLAAGVLSWLSVRGTADSLTALLLCLPVLVLPLLPFLTAHQDAAAYLRFFFAGAIGLAAVVGVARLRPHPLDLLGVLVLSFAIYQCAVLLAGGLTTYAVLRWFSWVSFIPIAFLFISRRSERALTRTALLAGGLLALGAGLQVLGLLGGDIGGLPLEGSFTNPVFARRYTSFAGNPNDFGLLMLCLAVVLFAFGQREKVLPGGRTLPVLATVLALAALLASSSRGAVLALVPVGAFLLYILDVRKVVLFLAMGLVSLAMIVAFVPALERSVRTNLDSIPTLIGSEDPSSSARLLNWRTRLENAQVNALFGSGYGGYDPGIDITDDALLGSLADRRALSRALTVDNGALKLWLEGGLVGVLLLVTILAVALARATELARHRATRVRGIIAGSILVAIAFRGLSVDLFDISPWNYILWLAIALSAGDGSQEGVTSDLGESPALRHATTGAEAMPSANT